MVNRFTIDGKKGRLESHETKPYREPGARDWKVIVDWRFPVGYYYEGPRRDVLGSLDEVEAKEIAACYRGQKFCTGVRIELRSEKYLDGYV